MKETSVNENRQSPREERKSLPIADAWLPDLEEAAHPPVRRRWAELTPAGKRIWLLRAGLLMALMMTLVLHPSWALRDVLVWGASLYVLFRKRKQLFARRPGQLSLAILLYAAIVTASVAYSVDSEASAREVIKLYVVLAMVFAAWHLFKKKSFLFGFLQVLIGCVLIVLICDVISYVQGLGREWTWGKRWAFGPYFGHPNTSSAIILLLMPISVFLLVASRSVWLKVSHGCFLGLGLFLIYVMASRTAQLSLAGMLVCGAVLLKPMKRKLLALGLVACLFLLACLNVRALNQRFVEGTEKTLGFRKENWKNTAALIAEKPVFGYGFGKRVYRAVYLPRFEPEIRYPHAHSLIFQTAFETGIVGLAAVLWIWAVAAWRLLKGYAANSGLLGGLFGSLFVSFLGISIYCLAEVTDGLLRSLSWLLLAMVGALTGKEKLEGNPAHGPKAYPPAATPVSADNGTPSLQP